MAQNIKASLPGQEVHYGVKGSVVIAGGTVTLDGANPTRVDCQAVHGIRIVEAVTAKKRVYRILCNLSHNEFSNRVA